MGHFFPRKIACPGLVRASLSAIVVAASLASSAAFADDLGFNVAGQTAPPPAELGGPHPAEGIPIEGWMLFPSMFVGGVFDDNIYRTLSSPTGALGVRLIPNIEADRDDGVHRTTIYANADAQLYPGYNANFGETASTVSGRVGLANLWSPTSDIFVHASVDYTRQDGPFGSTLVTSSPIGSPTSFVAAPTAVNFAGYRQFSDVTTVDLSVQKKLTDQIFIRVGTGVQDLIYERAPIGYTSALSGVDYSAFIRGGFWVTPLFNAFVETSGDLHRYDSSSLYDSNAYRAVAGLSSDLIGLFRGEAYGGLEQQFSIEHAFGAIMAPAYGARITYYPTEYLTVAASVDNSFGSAGASGVNPVLTAASTTLMARLEADYAMFDYWKAAARLGYADTRYFGSSSLSGAWLAGAGLSYSFWRNYALTFDYQFTRTNSTGSSLSAYSDNLASLGVTYHY
ncbi:MAG: outer membrane beta-barrel protein [Alphaproteobacteria bacterium]|nr:outer membrane beta-barrel protein [Alphaproteobacteria bacterium]